MLQLAGTSKSKALEAMMACRMTERIPGDDPAEISVPRPTLMPLVRYSLVLISPLWMM